jgi:hypothetical protein
VKSKKAPMWDGELKQGLGPAGVTGLLLRVESLVFRNSPNVQRNLAVG